MIIFLDLDGTILNARVRLHTLFCRLAPNVLPEIADYWSHKRAPRSHEWILANLAGWNQDQVQAFNAEWLHLIEQPDYLALDVLEPRALEAVQNLSVRSPLCLLTARRSYANLVQQLDWLGLRPYFSEVLATGGDTSKSDTVSTYGVSTGPADILVGDTGEDIDAARSLGVTSIAICNGFRCEDYLKKRGADRTYASLIDFASEHFQQ